MPPVTSPEVVTGFTGRVRLLIIYAVSVALRIAVGAVLVVAAIGKARNFGAFVLTVRSLGVPPNLVKAAAGAVIAIEAALGCGLLLGVADAATPFAALLLFACFSAISLWAGSSGIRVSCNCFGYGDRQLGRESLATSVMLAGAVGMYAFLPQSTDVPLPPEAIPVLLGLAGGALLVGRWLLAAPALVALVRQRRVLEHDESETLCGGS